MHAWTWEPIFFAHIASTSQKHDAKAVNKSAPWTWIWIYCTYFAQRCNSRVSRSMRRNVWSDYLPPFLWKWVDARAVHGKWEICECYMCKKHFVLNGYTIIISMPKMPQHRQLNVEWLWNARRINLEPDDSAFELYTTRRRRLIYSTMFAHLSLWDARREP